MGSAGQTRRTGFHPFHLGLHHSSHMQISENGPENAWKDPHHTMSAAVESVGGIV